MVRHWMKLGALALAIVGFGTAQAVFKVPDVAIERAITGQSVSVRFTQSTARLVELRVNGMSVGTRAVNGSMTNEASFRVDSTVLNEGVNKIEALIFDADGKLLDTQTSTVNIEAPNDSAVEISSPKAGQTVQGLLEIRVNVKNQLRAKMVSFIVNGDMRSMTNVAPYTYVIDTEMLPNGWHEVQVLVVDENNISVRSRKVRVFVNNPGGRTERVMPSVAVAAPTPNFNTMSGGYAAVMAKPSQAKPMNVTAPKAVTSGVRNLTPTGKRIVKPVVKAPVKPVVKPAVAKPVTAKPVTAKPVTAKPVRTLPAPVSTKPVAVKPVVSKPVTTKPVVAKPAPVTTVQAATATVRVTRGTRLNMAGPLTLSYNARVLNFDVQPRVQSGIALSPFRHLYEAAGGKVKWSNSSKTVNANGAANSASIRIGSRTATLNGQRTTLEYAAFIDRGRTVVPLSFISDTLNVNVDVDTKTGHVLITNRK